MMSNLQKITKELFERDVMLCIRTNSPTFRKYGKQIRGKLNSFYQDTKQVLKIAFNSSERDIPVEDIEFITEDLFKLRS